MRRQTHTVLLGVFTAAALTALGVGLWPSPSPMSLSVPLMAAEEEALPLPPEPPRLADSAEFERCFAMLRDDPEGARAYALMWDSQGGGDGARHCHALRCSRWASLCRPRNGWRRWPADPAPAMRHVPRSIRRRRRPG